MWPTRQPINNMHTLLPQHESPSPPGPGRSVQQGTSVPQSWQTAEGTSSLLRLLLLYVQTRNPRVRSLLSPIHPQMLSPHSIYSHAGLTLSLFPCLSLPEGSDNRQPHPLAYHPGIRHQPQTAVESGDNRPGTACQPFPAWLQGLSAWVGSPPTQP